MKKWLPMILLCLLGCKQEVPNCNFGASMPVNAAGIDSVLRSCPQCPSRDCEKNKALMLLELAQTKGAKEASFALEAWKSLDGEADSAQVRQGMAKALALLHKGAESRMNPNVHGPDPKDSRSATQASQLQWGSNEQGTPDPMKAPPGIKPQDGGQSPKWGAGNRQPSHTTAMGEEKDW